MRGTVTALILLLAVSAHAKKRLRIEKSGVVTSAVAENIQLAKTLMFQSNRQRALDQLEKAKPFARSRADLKEISEKRLLFLEQFFSSKAFQRFQEARSLAELQRWDECLREIDHIKIDDSVADSDNLLVLRLKADCQYSAKQYDLSLKTHQQVLTVVPDDRHALFGLVDIALEQKRYVQGVTLLEGITLKSSSETERFAILKARLLRALERPEEADEILKADHEAYLDHIEVLYELGMLYTTMSGHDWPARKMISLFVVRCKRMKESELKTRHLEMLLPKAQSILDSLDKKLGV